MHVILLVARLLLAGVFIVAGVAKLADRAGSRQALQNFGVPLALSPILGILLPLAELAVAGALVSTTTAWAGAMGAFLLLLIFCAGISRTLAQGRTPPVTALASSPPPQWDGRRSSALGSLQLSPLALSGTALNRLARVPYFGCKNSRLPRSRSWPWGWSAWGCWQRWAGFSCTSYASMASYSPA
jgi:uncharacterized membrane protein YphA (DoxX/SURF4 family)